MKTILLTIITVIIIIVLSYLVGTMRAKQEYNQNYEIELQRQERNSEAAPNLDNVTKCKLLGGKLHDDGRCL